MGRRGGGVCRLGSGTQQLWGGGAAMAINLGRGQQWKAGTHLADSDG